MFERYSFSCKASCNEGQKIDNWRVFATRFSVQPKTYEDRDALMQKRHVLRYSHKIIQCQWRSQFRQLKNPTAPLESYGKFSSLTSFHDRVQVEAVETLRPRTRVQQKNFNILVLFFCIVFILLTRS